MSQRRNRLIPRVVVAVAVVLGGGPALASGQFPPPSLRAVAEPVKSVFLEGEPVRVRLRIENDVPRCRPAFVDPFLTEHADGDRPFTVVIAKLVDERQQRVALEHRGSVLGAPLRPGDLLELPCGSFFGALVEIGPEAGSFWKNRLRPGTYTLTLSATLLVRTFFEQRRELLRAEAERRGMDETLLLQVLADQVLEANPITFSIAPRQAAAKRVPHIMRGDAAGARYTGPRDLP